MASGTQLEQHAAEIRTAAELGFPSGMNAADMDLCDTMESSLSAELEASAHLESENNLDSERSMDSDGSLDSHGDIGEDSSHHAASNMDPNTPKSNQSEGNSLPSSVDYQSNMGITSCNPSASMYHSIEGTPANRSGSNTPVSLNGSLLNSGKDDGLEGNREGASASCHPGDEGEQGRVFQCHLCSYSGTSKFHFNSHMNTHFDHKCTHCDYTSRTEGRLKRHIKDFHAEVPPDSYAGNRVIRTTNPTSSNKLKTYRCKQCNFVAQCKTEYWDHAKSHIKADKLLSCPKCSFVTEYKHHLEYHLRNHFGSKPFKCTKCNYSCVNKSMLNSHMRSHSNIYQYRCADCTYATKYCHSLKLHLRKYNHKPASIISPDMALGLQGVSMDMFGRRGPRVPKKGRPPGILGLDIAPVSVPLNGATMHHPPPMQFMLPAPPTTINGFHSNSIIDSLHGSLLFGKPGEQQMPPLPRHLQTPPSLNLANKPSETHSSMNSNNSNNNNNNCNNSISSSSNNNSNVSNNSSILKCNLCEFATSLREHFNQHLLLHAAENQDLCNLYGISSESLMSDNINQNLTHTSSSGLTSTTAISHYISDHSTSLNSLTTQASMALVEGMKHLYTSVSSSQETGHSSSTSATVLTASTPLVSSQSVMISQAGLAYSAPHHNTGLHFIEASSMEQGNKASRLSTPTGLNSPTENAGIISIKTEPGLSKPVETTPLDLSNKHLVEAELLAAHLSQEGPQGVSVPSSPPRRRRKGKAYKLDKICLKLQERFSPRNTPLNDSNEEYSSDSGSCHYEEGEELAETAERENGNLSPSHSHFDSGTLVNETPYAERNREIIGFNVIKGLTFPHLRNGGSNIKQRLLENTVIQAPELCISPTQNKNSDREVCEPQLTPNTYNEEDDIRDVGSIKRKPPSLIPTAKFQRTSMTERERYREMTPPKDEFTNESDSKINEKWSEAFECQYCDMAFRDCVMYTMHMGYHGYQDPFKCNMCGHQTKDRVSFFLHIARAPHL
uniref:Hunchback n=1 Tax=Euperipatoides rowelli TaxID=49087 RepID=A0A0G2T4I2_EUPRO|nr:hunchback [Euperipatoides rowelli]